MNDSVITASGLSKRFNGKTVVDGLDLSVPRGSIMGFLGPNGAGKTTTIRMLMGHLHPSAGTIEVLDMNPWHLPRSERQRIAYVSEDMNLPGWMSPRKVCAFNASFYPNWDAALAETLLGRFDLLDARAHRTLSKGQKRTVCLVLAMCTGADLLVLDEPASGLDVAARRIFLDALLEINRERETTIFFSSHLLTDIERVVDRVVILNRGRTQLAGELDTLKDQVRLLHFPTVLDKATLAKYLTVARCRTHEDTSEAMVLDFSEEKLARLCQCESVPPPSEVRGLNLEDLFVEILQRDDVEERSTPC